MTTIEFGSDVIDIVQRLGLKPDPYQNIMGNPVLLAQHGQQVGIMLHGNPVDANPIIGENAFSLIRDISHDTMPRHSESPSANTYSLSAIKGWSYPLESGNYRLAERPSTQPDTHTFALELSDGKNVNNGILFVFESIGSNPDHIQPKTWLTENKTS
jgi:hypothetical protein